MAVASSRMSGTARREQLLNLCAQVVDVEGFHAATLDRVASEAGVSRTVLYQHFGTLDGLHDAVIERAVGRAGETLAATGRRSGRSASDTMARVLEAVDADPTTWRLFLVIPPAGPPALIDALERARATIRREVMESIAENAVGAEDPELVARLVQVVADELVRLRLADPTVFTHERLLRQYRAVVVPLLRKRTRTPN